MVKNFNWKDLLEKHSLFLGLDPKEAERIITQLLDDIVSDQREYAEGAVIVREGELGNSVFLVGRGSVQVVLEGEKGSDTPIAILKQGEFFGEMALLEKKPRAATVRAKESCILLEIKGQEFLRLLDEHRDVESKMLLKLSERLRHANEQILTVRVKSVDDRLEGFNSKLEAQLKAVDASFKAALTVFEQTKFRTDEIISSADRSRSQRTWFFGIVATLLTFASAFGLKELLDLRGYVNRAEEAKQKIDLVLEKIEPYAEKVRGTSELLEKIILDKFQPTFRKALLSGTADDIASSYSTLQQIHTNISWFLTDVEIAIRENPERDYTDIAQTILKDSQKRNERIRAYYLVVTSAILVDKADVFNKQLADFRMYLKKDGPIKSEDKLNTLKDVFDIQKAERQKRFKEVEKLIPLG